MRISPFFSDLHAAYQAEIDDLASDSDGRDVLRQRLVDKRKELSFLLQMIEVSPEMVAVIFHQGFRFPLPAVMEQLLGLEADEFPEWDTLADAVQLAPWAVPLADEILREPRGAWFMTVAASLEFMLGRTMSVQGAGASDDEDQDSDDAERDDDDRLDADDERARDEAGADWMAEQGFDRKD